MTTRFRSDGIQWAVVIPLKHAMVDLATEASCPNCGGRVVLYICPNCTRPLRPNRRWPGTAN
jgi:DNA-directed RNA polymerase subunit RPC12/RpoP